MDFIPTVRCANDAIFRELISLGSEELEIQRARAEVSKLIRSNEQLEVDLDRMDVKIGLLVQNRISVQVRLSSVFLFFQA